MRTPKSVETLEDFGRIRLSKTFFMRDFLFSDIAAIHGLSNLPIEPELAIKAGTRLCEELLEPLQEVFGRIAIRSAYRSPAVNGFGVANRKNCASNKSNFGGHIWDVPDRDNNLGATVCIIVPSFYDRYQSEGDWKKLAWWIHDHLPYSEMDFYKTYWAFNLTWNEKPKRYIHNWLETPRVLTKQGMANHAGSHDSSWQGIVEACKQ